MGTDEVLWFSVHEYMMFSSRARVHYVSTSL